MSYLPLPTSKDALSYAIEDAVNAAERERNIALVEWYIIHYYLQGVRLFSVADWEHGDVSVAYETFEDELAFRWEHVLRQYRVALGRYMQIDTSPSVQAQGFGLDSVRKAGMGHALLQYMTAHMNHPKQKSRMLQLFLKYGTVGLRHYQGSGETLRDRTNVWIVTPWEIMSYPGEVQSLDDVRGIWHKRKVPSGWLKEMASQEGLTLPRDKARLDEEMYSFGESPDQYGELSSDSSGQGSSPVHETLEQGKVSEQVPAKDRRVPWVDLTEGWMFGDRDDEVLQYVVKVGRHVAKMEDYSQRGEAIICPLAIARHTDTGRFYGRGEIGPLIGINDQVEKMLSRQFQIVADMDEYGMILLPASSGVPIQEVKKRERRKVISFEPDPMSPQLKPDVLAPYNSGDFAGKVANLGVQLQEKIAGQAGGMFEGEVPGARLESAASLGFLHQTSNVGLIASSNNIADAYRQLYRSMLATAREELREAQQENPTNPMTAASLDLPLVDDRMVGLVLDPKSGSLVLSQNPLPHPNDLKVDVIDRNPINTAQKIAEAKEQLQMGAMTMTEFYILNFREGWDLPVANRAKWEAYRKAVFQKILLFNDGESPGKFVPMNYEADDPEVTLIVIQHLMSSLEFLFASDKVRTAFEGWKIQMEMRAGRRMPESMPMMEEAAEMAAAGQGGGGMPGGMAGGMAGAPTGSLPGALG